MRTQSREATRHDRQRVDGHHSTFHSNKSTTRLRAIGTNPIHLSMIQNILTDNNLARCTKVIFGYKGKDISFLTLSSRAIFFLLKRLSNCRL